MKKKKKRQIDIIRTGGDDPSTVFEAAKRIISSRTVSPEEINEIAEIAFDPENKGWSRVASIYTLGFVDRAAVTETRIREISCDPTQDHELRDYADEALYYFASRRHMQEHERDYPDAETYEGLRYREWRDQQTDLAPEDPNSFAHTYEGKSSETAKAIEP